MSAPRCFACGGPTRWIGGNLYKCYLCNQITEQRESGLSLPPRLKVFPRAEQVQEAATEGVYEIATAVPSEEGLSSDMVTFIRRVAEALTPLKGYENDREFISRALKVRNQFKQELTAVFEGKADFQKWYDKTKTSLGLHPTEMNRTLYNALEGLTSPEAIELRNAYEQLLKGGIMG